MYRKLYCARCGKEISRGEAMTEKIEGKYVSTHLDCHSLHTRKKTLDDMIHEALDNGPGTALAKKRRRYD